LRETWTSQAARASGGLNYGSYMNPKFDSYVDSARAALDLPTGRKFYTLAYQTIIADAPAIWLYEPRTVIGIHKRIKTTEMRADAWWTSLGDWFIPTSQQIARDRVRH
jgi:peptide/nickel transport system substrate-binding protein